jgi:glycine/D-amino acid oxidase-like deaminating enzyme
MRDAHDVVVVGGGFFGAHVALRCAGHGARVVLVEREHDLLRHASYANQARVHNGYHYPRSILTGLRSRVNFPRFVADFAECVDRSFRHYYAVAKRFSNVTAGQFETFCRRIGAPLRPAPAEARRLFDPHLIEAVYEAEEWAFDADKLKERTRRDLASAGVEVRLGTEAVTVRADGGGLVVEVRSGSGEQRLQARHVFNCTYSGINRLLARSGLSRIPFRYEVAEIALVEVAEPIRRAAITVMCGPFFSTMPFPPAGLHSLSHVRYTPHCAWNDRDGAGPETDPGAVQRPSRVASMIKDAARYVPLLAESRHVRSLFEVKTLLPSSDSNDSRPILFRKDQRVRGLVSVMGGKIDNVYDLPRELELLAL